MCIFIFDFCTCSVLTRGRMSLSILTCPHSVTLRHGVWVVEVYTHIHIYAYTYVYTYTVKTYLTDHLYRLTTSLCRSLYLGPKLSPILICYLPKPTTSLNGQFKFGAMVGRFRFSCIYMLNQRMGRAQASQARDWKFGSQSNQTNDLKDC